MPKWFPSMELSGLAVTPRSIGLLGTSCFLGGWRHPRFIAFPLQNFLVSWFPLPYTSWHPWHHIPILLSATPGAPSGQGALQIWKNLLSSVRLRLIRPDDSCCEKTHGRLQESLVGYPSTNTTLTKHFRGHWPPSSLTFTIHTNSGGTLSMHL